MNSRECTRGRLELAGLKAGLLLALTATGAACSPKDADAGSGAGGSAASAGMGPSATAGSGGSGGSGGSTAVGTSGPALWVLDYLTLREVDLATGKGRAAANLLDVQGDIYDLVPGPQKVWLTTSEGAVMVLDREAGTKQVLPIDTVETWGISALALGPDSAYIASGAKPMGDNPVGPPLVRVDAKSLGERARVDIFGEDFNESAQRMFVDSDALWLLRYDGFAVMKLDPETLAVQDTVVLGEDPANVTGPRKDLSGYGDMAQVKNTLWIFDQSKRRFPLLKLDKSSHEALYVRALSDEFGDAAGDCLSVVGNQDSVFALFCNEAVHAIVKLDGETGETLKTYDLGPGGASMLAEQNGKLYVDSSTSDKQVLEIDEQSGTSRVVYEGTGLIGGIATEVPIAGAP